MTRSPRSSGRSRPPPKPMRNRGGQPGNTNALKHGFYTRQYRKVDLVGLDALDLTGLKEEITLLRVYIRRVIDLSGDALTFSEAVNLLRVLCLASATLTRLVKTQHLFDYDGSGISPELSQALAEVVEEMGLRDDDPPEYNPSPWILDPGAPDT